MIKIYSIHYNKPEYIYFQYKTFQKFAKFPLEFIIVDNSVDNFIKFKIQNIIAELGLRCIDCKNSDINMSSISHQNSFKFILEDFNNGESIMILDHDVFLYNEITDDYYKNYEIVMLAQPKGNVIYPWPGLLIFNNIKNKEQLSFDSGLVEGQHCDTGGHLYYYILNNKPKCKFINEKYFDTDKMLMSNLDDKFIHLISGSGWNPNFDLEKKIEYLQSLI